MPLIKLVIKKHTYQILNIPRQMFWKLLNLNRGFLNSKMKTQKLVTISDESTYFKVKANALETIAKPAHYINLEKISFEDSQKPTCVVLNIKWLPKNQHSGKINNILGDNGALLIDKPQIDIPVLTAQNEYLHYYHAHRVEPGDNIKISSLAFPIWKMKISKNYIRKFLLTPTGGGFYLEYHHDQPHYHHNIHGEGYYILGKANASQTQIELSAFIIPKGHAIYTQKSVIHCDAALTGRYLVGYHLSQNFSTVLLRNTQDQQQLIQVRFTPHHTP